MSEQEFEHQAAERGYVRLPTGWRAVPENPTERQRNMMRREDNPAQAYIAGVKAAPLLPGQ